MMEGVGGVRKSIRQSWLAKGLGLGLLCWGLKVVQEEIPSEEISTLQIGSVAFQAGQYTSPQLHPCHRLFALCDFWLFPKLRGCRYETIKETKEAVTKVIDTLTQEDVHGALKKLLERYNKCIAAGWYYFKGDESFMCVLSIKVPIRKKSGNLSYAPHIYIYISKVGNCISGWTEGSLFNSYNTEMLGALLICLVCFTLLLIRTL